MAFIETLKIIARRVLPSGVRRSIWWVIKQANKCKGVVVNRVDDWNKLVGPGGKSALAKYLDQRATRRVRTAIIVKTDDAQTVRWLDRKMWQYPLDAWNIQEVVGASKPDIIVDIGTYFGGSAYFFACLCDLLEHGEIISIDIAARGTIPHPRITYLQGSSTDPEIVDSVVQRIHEIKAEKVFIQLDSDHRAQHVRRELEVYAPLVPVGCYIHVQDGNLDELPYFRSWRHTWGHGPMEAAKSFLEDNPTFIRDLEVELRYVMTEHPYGWLKRIGPTASSVPHSAGA